MAIQITVPRLGWTMEEGTFVGWLKKDGDFVQAGEPLFSLDGDKALQEVEAAASGTLRIPPDAPLPGTTVRVGDVLGHLLDEKSGSPPPAPIPRATVKPVSLSPREPRERGKSISELQAVPLSPAVNPPSIFRPRRPVTPRALRKATEFGIDWNALTGTGRGGRVRERDVIAAAADKASPTQPGVVAITDWTFADLAIEENILKAAGHDVSARQCKSEGDLIALVSEADAVITQFARLTANVVGTMNRARVIVRYGIGVDNVDLEAARERGIPVCNVPDYCIDEVADQTLAFILGLTRQVVLHTKSVQSGKWGLAVPFSEMRPLSQLAVGVIGFGRIGREVVRRLLPFKCSVLVFDPVVPAQEITAAGARATTLAEVLAGADVITLHCPSNTQTRKLISTDALGKMKRGALLINVARGDLVDTDALVDALQSGRLAGAALDVCDPEPIPAGHPLLKLPNVILAPHIASVSPKAVKKLRETVATLAATALRGELPPNVVNGISVPRRIGTSQSDGRLRPPLPKLPKGEGRGEGEGTA